MEAEFEPGLYIVATPIGNLGDISFRAKAVLDAAKVIACEDKRVTSKLLRHLGVKSPLIAYNDHSGGEARATILARAAAEVVALVSDAGTPLISDPGYKLVREARALGVNVSSMPGPSAAIMALTVSGLPSDRFMFCGFLPNKAKARMDLLNELASQDMTLIFYESPARLIASLKDMHDCWDGRPLAVARELTKAFEEVRAGTAAELAEWYSAHPPRGEIVLLAGPPETSRELPLSADIDSLLLEALNDMPAPKAAQKLAKQFGLSRKELYARAVELKSAGE